MITSLVEDNMSSLFLLLPLFLLFITRKYFKPVKNLPPGPTPWSIIGNIHQMGDKPHVSTAIFAQEYGPLISLRLGTQVLIVAASPEAAIGILKTHDRHLSARFVPNAFVSHLLPYTLLWSTECDENWRSLRALCRTEMFAAKILESQSSLRERKLVQMLDFLSSKKAQVVNIEEVVFTTLFNTLSNIILGKDFLDLKDEHGTASWLKEKLYKTSENGVAANISDFFPMLGILDLQGLRKETIQNIKDVFSYWEGIIKERRANIESLTADASKATMEKCFVDRLITNGFSNDQINVLALDLLTAGTDTTTSTIVWAMTELIKNKEAMFKIREELKTEFNSNTIVECELSNLSYLNACIKETLRLHPPAPFLLPHRALQTCEVMNYTIPRGAQILVNVWAIGRDPKIWEDPLSFKPERFLGSNIDFKGQDFEFIPFSAGRRMCPGLSSGIQSIQYILASLILKFNWVLPHGQDPAELDMNEKFGVTMQLEKPLQLVFNGWQD